ncbi:TPA: methyltransferase domain-containing protein [Candidatus Poribacteria bacterium]|nr:methyltransferase domain-containing protein [Candidatus Poribacteria bacterium]HIB90192.1 methyltransferase domain-containing protein [Candidatus Poribacteria bacterium]HIB99485.1 methyltransferase domain-containing protein [Candidatus Poribacteria bacterium]HIC18346.1 methyltransferase domain-containing protein [Candidatus Poribacteria bacterium]HIM11102.1 methyltransferase domain-containing protein [Candidatus Poribacteria bacterium]
MMDLGTLKQDILFSAKLRGLDFHFNSTWGLFSPRSVDGGTHLLVNQIEINEGDTCLDMGCGYGVVGIVMAGLSKTGSVYMVDKDFVAVKYSEVNVKRNHAANCKVIMSNVFSHVPQLRFDVIASNLPANVGKELLKIILLESKGHLKPSGKLYVVTISGLREYIKRQFSEIFGNYRKVKQGKNHTVALAVR